MPRASDPHLSLTPHPLLLPSHPSIAQIWRLVTCFAFFGRLSFNFFFQMMML
jgi:hypothetical protein